MGAECCKANGNIGTMHMYPELVNKSDLKTSISQATNLLRKAQTIKNNLKSCQEKTKKLTTLPVHNPLTFLQNLQVLLWALSATNRGKIQHVGFVISPTLPFLDLNSAPLTNESYDLLECLRSYLDTVTSEAQTMKEITEDLYALRRDLNEWEQHQGLRTDKEEDMATSYKKLVDEMKGIDDIEESLREAHAKLPWIMEKVHSLLATADEVGYEADRESIYDLKGLVNRFKVCLETGQEKKKLVMRVSTQSDRGVMKARDCNVQRMQPGRTDACKGIENQYQTVTFKSDYSSVKINNNFHSVGQPNGMKQSHVTERVKADDLNNQVQVTISKSKSAQGVGKLDFTKINEKINGSDFYKGIAVIKENLDEEDELSISIVQNSDRNKIARGKL